MTMRTTKAAEWFYKTSFNGRLFASAPKPLKSALGKDLTCECGKVLYWEDIGLDYRSVCCGMVRFERKD